MCIICAEWQSGKLTSKEAFRNIGEIINTSEDEDYKQHLFGLSEKILDSEVPMEHSEEMDSAWHDETYGTE